MVNMNETELESQILSILKIKSPIEYKKLVNLIDTSKFPHVIDTYTLEGIIVTQKSRNDNIISKQLKSLEYKGKIKVENINPPEFSSVKFLVTLN